MVQTTTGSSGAVQVHELIETFDSLDDSLSDVLTYSARATELSVAHHYLASIHTLAGLAAVGRLTKAGDDTTVQGMLKHARLARQASAQNNWNQVLTHARTALVSMPESDPGWLHTEIPAVPPFASPGISASSSHAAGVKIVWAPPLNPIGTSAMRASVSAMPGGRVYKPKAVPDVPV